MTTGQMWAGVDVGKEAHWACVVDDKGAVALSRKVLNDEGPIRELVTEINELAGEVSWTVDLTTVYAALLLTVLAASDTPVRYLAGRAVWQASGVYRGGEAKTDAKDARVIADQSRMRGTDLPVLAPDDDLITELRMLTAHRADLVADRTRTIKLVSRADQCGITDCGQEVGAETKPEPGHAGDHLSQTVAAKSSLDVGVGGFDAVIEGNHPLGQFGNQAGGDVLTGQTHRLGFRGGDGSVGDRRRVTHTDVGQGFRQSRNAAVTNGFRALIARQQDDPAAVLGQRCHAFQCRAHRHQLLAQPVAAWAGLAPVPRDSGKRSGRLHTPQRYSRRLRRVMYMSALTAARCDPRSKAYYQSKRDQGKKPIQATICLARRRTNVLYALIRDNRTWQPDSPPITESAA